MRGPGGTLLTDTPELRRQTCHLLGSTPPLAGGFGFENEVDLFGFAGRNRDLLSQSSQPFVPGFQSVFPGRKAG